MQATHLNEVSSTWYPLWHEVQVVELVVQVRQGATQEKHSPVDTPFTSCK